MEVYALLISKPHPTKADNPRAYQVGDIVDIRPTWREFGKMELKSFSVIKMDISIPCGDDFQVDGKWDCHKCQYNDHDHCEWIKYTSPEWTPGGMLEKPTLAKKRRYNIPVEFPAEIKTIVEKQEEKTGAEEQEMLSWAAQNPIQITQIVDKKQEVSR